MKNVSKYLFLLAAVSLTACFDREEFSDIPNIEFQDIRFVNTDDFDSLILSFSFEDENADIGLSPSIADLNPPFHLFDIVVDKDDNLVSLGQDPSEIAFPLFTIPVLDLEIGEESVTFLVPQDFERTPFTESDNRPPYSCDDYEIVQGDTLYVQRNEYYFNFYITFEQKVGENYQEVDFRQIFQSEDCALGVFNARIPFFDRDGKSGVFTYGMRSQGFELAFQDNTIRVRFFVYDRNLNKSNEVTSQDFTLSDIAQ